MLDTRLTDDITLRGEALIDRVAATPIGSNTHALTVMLAECDDIERTLRSPSTIYKLRAARHWLQLAYGTTLHSYPSDRLRGITLGALSELLIAMRTDA
jgi:hypothetical protein